MATTVVRYQAKPERADENQQLIEAVFAALDEQTRLLMGEWLVGIRRRARKAVVFDECWKFLATPASARSRSPCSSVKPVKILLM